MKRALAILALAVVLLMSAASAALAQEKVLTPAEIFESRIALNGRRVTVQGEAIGDILNGGPGHVWVNVLANGTAIGLWVPEEQAEAVESLGDFRRYGTEVRAIGIFNTACDLHHGDSDIHVEELTFVAEGHERDVPVDMWKWALAAVFAAAVAGAGYRYRKDSRLVG